MEINISLVKLGKFNETLEYWLELFKMEFKFKKKKKIIINLK